jgi:hypothetical protein
MRLRRPLPTAARRQQSHVTCMPLRSRCAASSRGAPSLLSSACTCSVTTRRRRRRSACVGDKGGGGWGVGGLNDLCCGVIIAQKVHAVEDGGQRRLVRVLQQVHQRPAASAWAQARGHRRAPQHLKNWLFFLSTISARCPPAEPPCISVVTTLDSSRLQRTRQSRVTTMAAASRGAQHTCIS